MGVRLADDEMIDVEELGELRHGQVRVHGAVLVEDMAAILGEHFAVGLAHHEGRRGVDARHGGGAEGGGPYQDVRCG